MMKFKSATIVLCLCLIGTGVAAQEVEFNYEGRVKIDGLLYEGPGFFKFAIVNPGGHITYWSNDGTSVAGGEPAEAVVTDVTSGVFNVIIGDASTPNMAPLDASIFNGSERVFLRVWFSDNESSGFEHLRPDRKITNPALLGSQSLREIHLYVDSASGDDQYPGLSPVLPKQTIQAAWDALPPMIRENATIHLAEGIYREQVVMRGKTVIGDATISVIGNPSDPDAVRVTGALAGAETTPVREVGFHLVDQRDVFVQGIRFDYCYAAGILLDDYASARVLECHFVGNYFGICVWDNSKLTAENLDVRDSVNTEPFRQQTGPMGIRFQIKSSGTLTSCVVDNTGIAGCWTGANSPIIVFDMLVSNCDYGFWATSSSSIAFNSACTVSNCSTGTRIVFNSVSSNPNGNVTYISCGTDVSTSHGGEITN